MNTSFSLWRARPFRSAMLAAGALAGLSLLWAASGTAGTLTIQYQITGGTYDGAPLRKPGGTYTVRVTATGPGTVVSGPATLLTLNPSSGLIPTPLLGEAGSAGPISHPTFTHLGNVSRSTPQGPGFNKVSATLYECHLGYQYTGWKGTVRNGASWSGIAGIGMPGALGVSSSSYRVDAICDMFIPTLSTHSGTYVGTEVSTSYVPEPSTLPLVVGGMMLAAALTGGRAGGIRPLARSDKPRSVNSPGDFRP